MINDLIRGDWYVIEIIDTFKTEMITSYRNFTIGDAEKNFEELKVEYSEKKLELLLVVNRKF